MMSPIGKKVKVAGVTGSNKRIGFAIVKALCTQIDVDVILTARGKGRRTAAVTELQKARLVILSSYR